jgi:hypothetical protein
MEKKQKPKASADQKEEGEALQHLGRELHAALFPEEYDHMYDSVSEAKDRQRGKNPMSAEYEEKTNTLRAQLGFTPFSVGPDAYNDDTYSWVMKKLRQGKEAELRNIVTSHTQEDADAKRELEQARLKVQTPSWLNQRIDEMLASEKFLAGSSDHADPKVIAFRILGELFEVNPMGESEPDFLQQIRRSVTDLPDFEYQELFRHAKREWMDVYGF